MTPGREDILPIVCFGNLIFKFGDKTSLYTINATAFDLSVHYIIMFDK